MKTVLLIFMFNMMAPNEQAVLSHRAFDSVAQCKAAAQIVATEAAKEPMIGVKSFCVDSFDLTN